MSTTTTTTTTPIVSPDLSLLSKEQQERIVYGKDDALFGYIEKQQHELLLSSLNIDDNTSSLSNFTKTTLFGHVLDAGTGLHSLRWIASLCYMNLITSFTAITADHTMQQNCQQEINDLGISQYGTILCGHWLLPSTTTTTTSTTSSSTTDNENHSKKQNGEVFTSSSSNSTTTSSTKSSSMISISEQLHGQTYDVIIVDYLIGAMDGFIPYQQDLIISKLISLLKKSNCSCCKNNNSHHSNTNSNSHYGHSRMYIIGLEPIPDQITNKPSNGQQQQFNTINEINIMNLICKVRQVRDACILLAGQRCYREYPMEWIIRQIETYRKSYNNNSNDLIEEYDHNNNHDCYPIVYKYKSKQFPILYRSTTIIKQINVGRSKLSLLPIVIRNNMEQLLNDLENQSKLYFDQYIKSQQEESTSTTTSNNSGKIQFGFDYVVTIECT